MLLDNLRLPESVTNEQKNSVISAYFDGKTMANLTLTSREYLDSIIQIISDMVFVCPTFELVEIYTNVSNKAYLYEHTSKISTSKIGQLFGVSHQDEIPFVFGEAISNKVIYYF